MKVQRLLLSVIALVALTTTAWADITKWIPEVIDGEPTEKVKNPAPQIRVRLFGEPMPAADVWNTYMLSHAKDDMKNPPLGVTPTRAIPYHKSNETLGIVLLIEGHEYYFGNDVYKQAQDCKDPAIIASGQPCKIVKVAAGVFTVISGALEAPGAKDDEAPTTISRAGPPGSKGVMIVYSAGPEKRYEGDLKNLTADKLGDQRLQEGKTSRTFIEGLQAAQQALTKIGTNRKALFIFSDGFDVADATEITAIKKKLDADKVEVFAFYLEAVTDFIPDDPNTIKASKTKLDILSGGRVAKAKDQDALKIAITQAVTEINSRYSLVFPGYLLDAKTKRKAGFNWDGNEHALTLKLGKDGEPIENLSSQGEVVPTPLVLAPKWGQSAAKSRWWLWIVIPGGVLLLGIIVASLGKKKPAPAPAPVMVAAPIAAPPPVASAPPNANKTMMVNISSGDGLPVVGWIVPIQGEKQFQTFKLQYGETRIGTTSNAHIVLNDGFMSTDHAKIVMSPTGFTLVDNNSTNGTFANERRIQRHELVDNDMIMFGKTVCKFKTILGT